MNKTVTNQIKNLRLGDLVRIDWSDASIGKSLGTGGVVDVPVKSWGIYIGAMGKRNPHVVLAQNNFQYGDGVYDIDYIAIPKGWIEKAVIIGRQQVTSPEAEQLYTSFLRGGRRTLRHKQQKVKNHE